MLSFEQPEAAKSESDLSEFIGVYPADVVHHDEESTKHRLEELDRTNEELRLRELHELAKMLESVIVDEVANNNWLGPEAKAVHTSIFDDLFAGADLIVDLYIKGESQPLAVAIDITYSNNLEEKFSRIMNKIEAGDLGDIKYHRAPDGYKGPIHNVPRLVIAADQMTARSISNDWSKGGQEMMAKHPFQFQVLEQLLIQCEGFAKKAKDLAARENAGMKKQKFLTIARTYRDAAAQIEVVYQEKLDTIEDDGHRDQAHARIKDFFHPRREARH